MAADTEEEKFNYCVGRPWGGASAHNPEAISTYAYGREVFYGTMTAANHFREYVERQTGQPHFVYRLVLVEESN